MKISNRVHQNISFTLMILGLIITIVYASRVIGNPSSGKAWFELCGAILITYLELDSFLSYSKKAKEDAD